MRPRRLAPIALLAALALIATLAHAGKVYRWSDRAGSVHYGGDRPAETADVRDLREISFSAEPGAAAKLRVEADADGYLAWADNQLSGPIEVRLRFARSSNMQATPPLPARAAVPAQGSVLVARLSALDRGQDSRFELQLEAVPGSSNARPRDVEYQFPLRGQAVVVEQGYGGRYSHADAQNFYAVDFAAPIGTPVIAARAGVVMQVENDFGAAGLNQEQYGGRANFVRIAHDDGSMAVYAHLAEGGVQVRVGQQVRAGQVIGLSGNTGFTSGPHLHFAVQVNRSMQLQSVPFRMFGPGGILRFGVSH